MDVIQDTTDRQVLYRMRQEAIGQLLKSLRREHNLRQADIADVAGLGQPDVSKVESGERGIKFVEIDFFAQALGMETGALAARMLETMWHAKDDSTS